MRLTWPIRLGRRLEWTASVPHPVEFEIRQPRWPPFFATAFFLPRVTLRIRNKGDELADTTFGLYIRQYDGPPGNIPSLTDRWADTAHRGIRGPWPTGRCRRITLKVRARNLPHEGTYVLRIDGTKMVPLGTVREEVVEPLSKADIPDEIKEQFMRSSLDRFKEWGVDLDAPQRGSKGEPLLTIHVIDYFRVEPLSSVLTFLIATGSLLTALAGILVVVVTVWG